MPVYYQASIGIRASMLAESHQSSCITTLPIASTSFLCCFTLPLAAVFSAFEWLDGVIYCVKYAYLWLKLRKVCVVVVKVVPMLWDLIIVLWQHVASE